MVAQAPLFCCRRGISGRDSGTGAEEKHEEETAARVVDDSNKQIWNSNNHILNR